MTHLTSNEPSSIEVHLEKRLAETNRDIREYLDSKFKELHEAIASGYPEGNAALHKRWHEDQSKSKDARKQFLTAVASTIMGSVGATAVGSLLLKHWIGK